MFALGLPWLLMGALVALPALFVIYKLRQRTKRNIVVSSLFLWQQVQPTRAGGQKLRRFQSSWLFWLELLVLCLLLLAAADPTVSLKRDRGPLMIVLDDSFSMLAGGADSPRQKAEVALRKVLKGGDFSFVRFILAGREPRLLGGPIAAPTDVALKPLFAQWRGQSPAAALPAAISLAWQLGGARARLLVLTDHPSKSKLPSSRVRWWAFGTPHPNVAITHASRVRIDQKDWCLFEVVYFGKGQKRVTLSIREGSRLPVNRALQLRGGQPKRLRLPVKERGVSLVAAVQSDQLTIDDRVTLLPIMRRQVKVHVGLPDGDERKLLLRTLGATKGVQLTKDASRAELRWTQQPRLVAPSPATWGVHWRRGGDDAAYSGPFVVFHPSTVTHGLSLRGVIWGTGKGKSLPGLVLIAAGDVPLLTQEQRADGGQSLHLRWRQSISTLSHTSNWPILIWNIIHWRQKQMPGLIERNLRLGSDATLHTRPSVDRVTVKTPGGQKYQATVLDARLQIPASAVGKVEIRAGKATYSLMVNALQPEESDLRQHKTGRWGAWPARTERRRANVRIAWLLLVLVLAALSFHGWLTQRIGETS